MYKLLTDYRRKNNNIKLSKILNLQVDEIKTLFKTVEEWRSVDAAEGLVLDEIGSEIGQLRRGATDEVFRYLIKIKMLSNNSKGDIFTVIKIVSMVLDLDEGQFDIKESYLDNPSQVGMVDITELPFDTILSSGLPEEEFLNLVDATLAAGIGVNRLELAGTFEIVDDLEENHELGFADVDMTTGGYFGAAFAKGDD